MQLTGSAEQDTLYNIYSEPLPEMSRYAADQPVQSLLTTLEGPFSHGLDWDLIDDDSHFKDLERSFQAESLPYGNPTPGIIKVRLQA